jgi:hypothetical protein
MATYLKACQDSPSSGKLCASLCAVYIYIYIYVVSPSYAPSLCAGICSVYVSVSISCSLSVSLPLSVSLSLCLFASVCLLCLFASERQDDDGKHEILPMRRGFSYDGTTRRHFLKISLCARYAPDLFWGAFFGGRQVRATYCISSSSDSYP